MQKSIKVCVLSAVTFCLLHVQGIMKVGAAHQEYIWARIAGTTIKALPTDPIGPNQKYSRSKLHIKLLLHFGFIKFLSARHNRARC